MRNLWVCYGCTMFLPSILSLWTQGPLEVLGFPLFLSPSSPCGFQDLDEIYAAVGFFILCEFQVTSLCPYSHLKTIKLLNLTFLYVCSLHIILVFVVNLNAQYTLLEEDSCPKSQSNA